MQASYSSPPLGGAQRCIVLGRYITFNGSDISYKIRGSLLYIESHCTKSSSNNGVYHAKRHPFSRTANFKSNIVYRYEKGAFKSKKSQLMFTISTSEYMTPQYILLKIIDPCYLPVNTRICIHPLRPSARCYLPRRIMMRSVEVT